MKHNILTNVLALLLAASAFAAVGCGDASVDTGEVTDGGTDAIADTTAAVTENIYAHDLGSYDFGGETWNLYTRELSSLHYNFDSAASDGTTLNDEIFARNARLEETYNVVIEETTEENDTAQARLSVMAGEDTYDIIHTRCVYAFNYALEGLLRPVSDLPEIDLSKPYWDKELTDAVAIGNTPFFAVGAYNITGYDFTHMLAFNKELAANFDFDNIYQTVLDGKWTFDAMREMMMTTVSDLNGDGTMNGQDRYGLLSTAKQILPCFWIAAGQESIKMDANDYPTYSMLTDESFQSVFVEIFDLVYENSAWYRLTLEDNVIPENVTMFIGGQALFIDMPTFWLEDLRNMDADFGLIPYPKYNEEQKSYYSRIEGCEQTCIPVTNVANLEMTGVLLEAMASDSAQNLVPAYYETLLKSKLSRDNDSEAMLEIIFDSRVFDWGDTIWCPEIRDGQFAAMMRDNKRDIASVAAKLEKMMNRKITDAITAFEDLD